MRDLSAALRNHPPIEHDYDRAPIGMPGSIQPYGVLLVADPKTRKVQFVSNNSAEMLGLKPSDILEKSYLQLCGTEVERKYIVDNINVSTILFPNPVRMTIGGQSFDAVFHAETNAHLIQLEPANADSNSYDHLSSDSAIELFDPPSVAELFNRAVNLIRKITGYDRVMLYRFDSRYNGQVIAESVAAEFGSFLGLFFPSSDIGSQARDLYLENFTRYIPNIGGSPVSLAGIFPGGGHADTAHPVDMSHANLRSVVPCHITYLRNIGVQASMSFSINVDNHLWGLFACHHYSPRTVPYEHRVVCEQAAMMFIFRLASMTSTAARYTSRKKELATLATSVTVGAALRKRLTNLAQDWTGSPDFAVAKSCISSAIEAIEAETNLLLPADPTQMPANVPITYHQKILLDLVEADSAAIVHQGQVTRIGDAPPAMAVYAIASMFGRDLPDLQTLSPHIYATDGLSMLVSAAEDIKDRAAGVMAAALSLNSLSYILWFRREQIVHATWAGNPSADAMSTGADGLNPRASFEAWKHDIRNLSRPWAIEDVAIADELCTTIRDVNNEIILEPKLTQTLPALRPPPKAQTILDPKPERKSESRVIRIGHH